IVNIQFAADLFASQGKTKDAEAALALMDKIEKKPGIKDRLLGDYYSRYVGPEEALKHIKTSTAAAPTTVGTWRALIGYCAPMGKYDEAASVATRSVQTFPTQPGPTRLATEVLSTAGRWNEAVGMAKLWRDRQPANPMVPDIAQARGLIQLKQTKDAVAVLAP